MLVLTPPDADPLLLTGANDAQLFAYSIRRFQTVSISHLPSHVNFHFWFLSMSIGNIWSLLYPVHQVDVAAACLMHWVLRLHVCKMSMLLAAGVTHCHTWRTQPAVSKIALWYHF
jgi:hypothetical protein